MDPIDDGYAHCTDRTQAPAHERLLEILRSARRRKAMYFSPVEPRSIIDRLSGLRTGCTLAGLEWSPDDRRPALERRALKLTAAWEDGRLAACGLGPEAVADELLAIEIEMWGQADATRPAIDRGPGPESP